MKYKKTYCCCIILLITVCLYCAWFQNNQLEIMMNEQRMFYRFDIAMPWDFKQNSTQILAYDNYGWMDGEGLYIYALRDEAFDDMREYAKLWNSAPVTEMHSSTIARSMFFMHEEVVGAFDASEYYYRIRSGEVNGRFDSLALAVLNCETQKLYLYHMDK